VHRGLRPPSHAADCGSSPSARCLPTNRVRVARRRGPRRDHGTSAVAGRPENLDRRERDLADTFWNAPFVVAPGDVTLRAEAPGHRPFDRGLHVDRGQTVNVTVVLESVPTTQPLLPSASPGPGESHAASERPTVARGRPFRFPYRAAGWASSGLGSAGIILGIIGAAQYQGAYAQYIAPPPPPMPLCPLGYLTGQATFPLPARCQIIYNAMTAWSSLELAGFITGGVLIVAGTAFVVAGSYTQRSSASHGQNLVACTVLDRGITCVGRF